MSPDLVFRRERGGAIYDDKIDRAAFCQGLYDVKRLLAEVGLRYVEIVGIDA